MGKNAAYDTGLGKRVGPRLRERAVPCPPAARGSLEAGITQPRVHFFCPVLYTTVILQLCSNKIMALSDNRRGYHQQGLPPRHGRHAVD